MIRSTTSLHAIPTSATTLHHVCAKDRHLVVMMTQFFIDEVDRFDPGGLWSIPSHMTRQKVLPETPITTIPIYQTLLTLPKDLQNQGNQRKSERKCKSGIRALLKTFQSQFQGMTCSWVFGNNLRQTAMTDPPCMENYGVTIPSEYASSKLLKMAGL